MEASSTEKFKYECRHCQYKTNKKSNHDNHTKKIHEKVLDSCPECGKQIANLNQHLRVSHKIFKASSREKVCDVCNKKFFNLEAHKLKAHNIKNKPEYICNICLKAFSKKDHLTRHETVVHFGVRQTCPYCQQQFSHLDRHIKTKHTQTNPKESVKVLYPCNLCNKVFNKRSVLNTHKETIHGIQLPNYKQTCQYCGKGFANLSQHIDIVHNISKKFSCQKCHKQFYDNRELRRHHIKYLKTGVCEKEVSQENFRFACDFDFCTYKSNKKSNMEMHRQSVHLNFKIACPECGKQLSSKANLNSHVKNVHDKKLVNGVLEKNPFHLSIRCKLCDYTTNRAMHMDRHMLSVHSEAAFETVEQVYQASTQHRAGDIKPTVSNLIKNQHPRSNAKLPQFANLVRLEKIRDGDQESCEVMTEDPSEMILGDIDIKKTDVDIEGVERVDGGVGSWEEIQFVNTAADQNNAAVQFLSRRVSTDSSHSQDTLPLADTVSDQQVG